MVYIAVESFLSMVHVAAKVSCLWCTSPSKVSCLWYTSPPKVSCLWYMSPPKVSCLWCTSPSKVSCLWYILPSKVYLALAQIIQSANNSYRSVYHISIHRKGRMALWLSRRFMGVLSVGEIHCLRRLRKEGSPDFLSRS